MPPKKKLKGDSKQLSLTSFMKKDDNNNEVNLTESAEIQHDNNITVQNRFSPELKKISRKISTFNNL